jgi:glycosyltransferase involved in cell wall biosynthesis
MPRGLNDETRSCARRLLLVSEDDLSHGALARRLARALADQGMHVTLRLVPEPNRIEARLVSFVPALGAFDLQPLRWKLRYSLRARRMLARDAGADVALLNTQACGLLSRGIMARLPVVLSVDATGRQFGALEYWRARRPGERVAELPLDALERRAYAGARRIVAWTEWTARSLRDDYGVADERIHVLHFGVEAPDEPATGPGLERDGRLRVLFVGNGVERKGLDTLLRARTVARSAVEVDVVTGDPLDGDAGVTVHRGIGAGSARLAELYAGAQAFVLPTRADVAPWVVLEAMAAGLPVVASAVGAIPELVGDAGMLVEPGDVAGLAATLDRLAEDRALRKRLAAGARARAMTSYEQSTQAQRLSAVLREAALT